VSGHAVDLPRRFASLVKIEHTVFALPFAYVGAFLAVDDVPSGGDLLWITVAMVGARSLAMSLNRLIDAEIDARNPRTALRELPRGALSRPQVWAFCALSLAVFLVAVWQLDPIVRWLWPIPVAGFVIYPYLKRFTWLSHPWLGAVDGLAPVGAWVAITGELPWEAWALGAAVAAWIAGFDLFYSLFDVEIDRREGLHSWATRWGERGVFLGAACADGRSARRRRPRARRGRRVLARRRDGRRAPRLRTLARPSRRPAPPRRGVLHGQRRDQPGVLRVRARRRAVGKSARSRYRHVRP
jgi:putative 4-hydroxybenzoate polyprenyltransferase